MSWVGFQPAIGNLSIAVELLLKSVVAAKSLSHLYTNLPEEAQILLDYPESLSDQHKPNVFIRDMKTFGYKTVELDKAVMLFNMFFPDKKQEFKQFFASLAVLRNVSVHAAVPDFQRYELERLAFFATRLFEFISDAGVYKFFSHITDERTTIFVNRYIDDEVSRIKKKIDEARKRSKASGFEPSFDWDESWEKYGLVCPVCEEFGVATGETTEVFDDGELSLMFECYSFECHSCGLKLSHYDEMERAGMDTLVDRSDDIEEWVREFHSYLE